MVYVNSKPNFKLSDHFNYMHSTFIDVHTKYYIVYDIYNERLVVIDSRNIGLDNKI